MGRRGSLHSLTMSLAMVVVLVVLPAGCSGSSTRGKASPTGERSPNPYFTAPFTARRNSYTFGQDPTWTRDGRVLSNENDGTGTQQIYVSELDGSEMRCLTCGQPGPNGFPLERPQGDWILFCSWRGQEIALGAPCLGGYGTDMYVMRPDGSHVTRLTTPGASYSRDDGPVFDNYHPSWSPDGTQIVWTHVNFVGLEDGGAQWTILVGDFVDDGSGPPRLGDVTVVVPSGDMAYETQVWAPDGSGFLYTLFTGPDEDAGWMNSELYFMRLSGKGASLAHPKAEHLTDNHPGWDEQAVFTPDMENVIFMSSRDAPTWYQTVVTQAQLTGYMGEKQNAAFGPLFFQVIADPRFHTDLYELDLSTRAIRRLTSLHHVVPEFTFDATGLRVLWTEGGGPDTIIGRFDIPSAPASRGPTIEPAAEWVGAPRDGELDVPEEPFHPEGIGGPGGPIPEVFVEAATLLHTQLAALAKQVEGLPESSSCCGADAG